MENVCYNCVACHGDEPRRAVNYLQDFQGISTELDDLEGQGRSYEALAAAYQVQ